MLLLQPTPKEFLRCRLTPDMEHKLLYIVQNVKKKERDKIERDGLMYV